MITEILQINENNLNKAVDLLTCGELVAFPTETVYGLGAIGTNSQAVKKIFEAKGRPTDNPLIAHVHKDFDFSLLVNVTNDYALKLKNAFMPGPLTMVFKSKGVVCSEAVCGGSTLAIRVPSHEGTQKLLKKINAPVVAPSANVSKHVSPVTAQHVFNDLNGKIPLILDGGKSQGGIESTVLDVTGEVPRILRAGLITKEMIESVVGVCEIAEHKETDAVRSPGVKYSHYMPRCLTLRFTESQKEQAKGVYKQAVEKGQKPIILCENKFIEFFKEENYLDLGKTAEDVASNLFYDLRVGEDTADLIIVIEPSGRGGVYEGVLNRLCKATKKAQE